MIQDEDSNIVIAGGALEYSGSPDNRCAFVKLDQDLQDTIYVKTYKPDTLAGLTHLEGIKLMEGNDYLIWGYTLYGSSPIRTGFISLVNDEISPKWTVYIPHSDTSYKGSEVMDCVLGPDGKLAYVSDVWMNHGNGYIEYDIDFGILDTLGNVYVHRALGGPYYDGGSSVSLSNDSSIVLTYAKGEILDPDDPWPEPNFDQTFWRINYLQCDWNGDTMRYKKYGKLAGDTCYIPHHSVWDTTLQHLFLPVGHTVSRGDSIYIWGHDGWQSQMLLLDENGDSLWHHDIRDNENFWPNTCYRYSWEGVQIWKMIPRANEGFIGFGTYRKINSFEQRTWMAYIDEYGCTEWNCSLGIEEGEKPLSFEESLISVYPNPFSSFIRLEVTQETFDGSVGIYSINGTFLRDCSLVGSEIIINVSDLSRGIYILIFREKGVVIGRELIVKE
jgi:hypothetical protein